MVCISMGPCQHFLSDSFGYHCIQTKPQTYFSELTGLIYVLVAWGFSQGCNLLPAKDASILRLYRNRCLVHPHGYI